MREQAYRAPFLEEDDQGPTVPRWLFHQLPQIFPHAASCATNADRPPVVVFARTSEATEAISLGLVEPTELAELPGPWRAAFAEEPEGGGFWLVVFEDERPALALAVAVALSPGEAS